MEVYFKSLSWFNAHLQNVEELKVEKDYISARTRSEYYEVRACFKGLWLEVQAAEGTRLQFGDNTTTVCGKLQIIYRGDCLYCGGPDIKVWANDLLLCAVLKEEDK